MPDAAWRVVTIGWEPQVIETLADPIERETGFEFHHIPEPSMESAVFARSRPRIWPISRSLDLPQADLQQLAVLERDGVPTIHNMIMGDRVVNKLPYEDAVRYASYLAGCLEARLCDIRPAVVIGGFDSLHNGIAMAVAKKLGIPWFAINFATIPAGMAGFARGMTPGTTFSVVKMGDDDRRLAAENMLKNFEQRRLHVPAYLSANNLNLVLTRLPAHLRALGRSLGRVFGGRFDKYTQYPLRRIVRDYVRKRRNLFLLPQDWFYKTPPAKPFIFFGLHMQPESSIDVWAPFFANQFAVVESIARAVPPTHEFLVKLHKSDADNYSRTQLAALRRLPGVKLVWPFSDSREFIEKASLVVSIQGYMTLEAGMLGRPALLFGDSHFVDLPSVSRVKGLTDLPAQIREKLKEEPPGRDAIVAGLMRFLSHFAPGCYNNWETQLSRQSVVDLATQFRELRRYLQGSVDSVDIEVSNVAQGEMVS